MKTKLALTLLALAVVSLNLQAATSALPAPLPEFMDHAQLAKWNADQTAAATAASANEPSTQFYTGKPYVADAGGYVYKYRTYNPEMSRWTSTDPSGYPDGPNNNLYVSAPTFSFDPNGAQMVTIQYDAFIAPSSITFLGRTFKGDNHGFGSTTGTFREYDSVTVNTTTESIGSSTTVCGTTYELNSSGAVVNSGTASTSSIQNTIAVQNGCNFTLTMTGDASNPLVTGAPGIYFNVTFTFNLDTGELSWSGTHVAFPNHEMLVDGTSEMQFSAVSAGTTPWSLFGVNPVSFSGSINNYLQTMSCE